MNIVDTFRFNARVLEEGSPLDRKDPPFPDRPVEMAFSPEASSALDASGIPFRRDSGGVRAAVSGAALTALKDLPHRDAPLLAAAAAGAYRGWCRVRYSWKLAGNRVLELGDPPLLMGILNVTPDSFSDGGRHFDREAAVKHAMALYRAGADLIDIGGESTRPGSDPVEAREELARTVPVIREIAPAVEVPVSIDTTKAQVAVAALDAGASIVNDISGLTFDPDMAPLVAETGAGAVIMHIRGTPKDMQERPRYEDTLAEVCRELRDRLQRALEAGIDPEQLVLDPGIGFGKEVEDNLRLLGSLGELRSLGFPLLLGCSRKSFLGAVTGRAAADRILETGVTSVLAALAGVQILRVHDVAENRICLKVVEAIQRERRRRA